MQAVARTPLDLIIANYRMPRLTSLDLLGLLEKEGYRIPTLRNKLNALRAEIMKEG